MALAEVVVEHEVGLHARPATIFVKTASQFPAIITIRNITIDSKAVNAKSILSVLSIGVNSGNRIEIEASGENADEALAALVELVNANFGE
jgi:phosphotransferase system HPr (HPr) family protein